MSSHPLRYGFPPSSQGVVLAGIACPPASNSVVPADYGFAPASEGVVPADDDFPPTAAGDVCVLPFVPISSAPCYGSVYPLGVEQEVSKIGPLNTGPRMKTLELNVV